LVLTLLCNRNCGYCFTRGLGISSPDYMEDAVFYRIVDQVIASGQTEIRILGGEPSLHPKLPAFLEYIMNNGCTALIFTNGIMDDRILDYATRSCSDRINFLVNVDPCLTYSKNQWDKLTSFMWTYSHMIMPGTTIHSQGQKLDYLLDYIEKFNLQRKVRLGIAHPSPDLKNRFVAPRDYIQIGADVASFFSKATDKGVNVLLDCGFVPCMFDRRHPAFPMILRRISQHKCEPITDILPDGNLISCFPLGLLTNKSLHDYPDISSLQGDYTAFLDTFSPLGIFRECPICMFKSRGMCDGGCVAQRIARFD